MESSTLEKVVKFYSRDLALRSAAAVTTELVRNVTATQDTSPPATIALGRLITAAVLMATQQKDGQRIGIRVMGDGPLGELFVDASFEGKARGYVQNPQADVPLKNGQVDVGAAVGKGVIAVTRTLPFQKAPQQGIVPLVTGEISADLAGYFRQSQQTPSLIALTVSLDKDGLVTAAGGVLTELMPGASEEVLQILEKKAEAGIKLSHLLTQKSPELQMAQAFSHQDDLVAMDHPHPVMFFCPCSMDRVERTLTLLGRATLSEMVLKSEPVLVNCEFCQKEYSVLPPRLRELLSELEK